MLLSRCFSWRLARLLAVPAVLGLALAACAAAEPRPALVAKSDTGSYGYSETELSDSRYQVVYESPAFTVPVATSQRESRLAEERQRAYDFALWHAADTAKTKGYAALSVEQDRRDADVSVRSEPAYRAWPGFYPYYGYPYHGYRYGAWGMYDDWPGYGSYQRWASARVTVSLQVRFLGQMEDDALPVDATLSRLASTYGQPTYD